MQKSVDCTPPSPIPSVKGELTTCSKQACKYEPDRYLINRHEKH